MAILCEAISVVLKYDRTLEAFGTFQEFQEFVPNLTLATDSELIRVGFLTPDEVEEFVGELANFGLTYILDETAQDLIVVDQIRGPMVSCDWVEFGHVEIHGNRVAAARLRGSKSMQLFTPEEWEYEGSVSETFEFVPLSAEGKGLKYLRREGSTDVYISRLSGKEVFMPRSKRRWDK